MKGVTKQEYLDAVRQGVVDAVREILGEKELKQAIEWGAWDAIEQTDMSGAIRTGTNDALEQLALGVAVRAGAHEAVAEALGRGGS